MLGLLKLNGIAHNVSFESFYPALELLNYSYLRLHLPGSNNEILTTSAKKYLTSPPLHVPQSSPRRLLARKMIGRTVNNVIFSVNYVKNPPKQSLLPQ